MPTWSEDVATGRGRFDFRKGGQVARTSIVNGNTVGWDIDGVMVYCEFPNPNATVNLAGLTFETGDHDLCRDMMFEDDVIRTAG